jgi:hypothetical protein
MGIAADPNETVEVYPEAYADAAADRRPTFVYRHLTNRQSTQRRRLLSECMAEQDDAKRLKLEASLLAFNLATWRNVLDAADGKAIPFDAPNAERVHDALTEREVWEIIARAPIEMRLSADAKKKSASSPATGTASSAPTAPVPGSA